MHVSQLHGLRLGVDVSNWIYKACMGYCDILADERHLTNFGRLTLLQEQQQRRQRQQQQQQQEEETGSDTDPQSPKPTTATNTSAQDPAVVMEYVTTCVQHVLRMIQKLQEASQTKILVVMDGATPPIKTKSTQQRFQKRLRAQQQRDADVHVHPFVPENDHDEDHNDDNNQEELLERRIASFRRAGAGEHFPKVIAALQQGLREQQIPFLVAPYESDGQLAWLSYHHYVDVIVTEDSDLLAGCRILSGPILYRYSSDENTGILVRRHDWGACTEYNLMDMSPAMLAVMFVAVGCDYDCPKLRGIGLKKACTIVRGAFLGPIAYPDPLAIAFRQLFQQAYTEPNPEAQAIYQKQFLAALLQYRHPIVYSPVRGRCIMAGIATEDVELLCHAPYRALVTGPIENREAYIGRIIPSPLSTHVAEGWVSPKTLRPWKELVSPVPPTVLRDVARYHGEAENESLDRVTAIPDHMNDTNKELEASEYDTSNVNTDGNGVHDNSGNSALATRKNCSGNDKIIPDDDDNEEIYFETQEA